MAKYEEGNGRVCVQVLCMSSNKNKALEAGRAFVTTFNTKMEVRGYHNKLYIWSSKRKKEERCHIGYCRSINKIHYLLTYENDRPG
jgi:hypothetical protein